MGINNDNNEEYLLVFYFGILLSILLFFEGSFFVIRYEKTWPTNSIVELTELTIAKEQIM